jgi:acetyltransferase-like isoleucine patch superfamily enzyme
MAVVLGIESSMIIYGLRILVFRITSLCWTAIALVKFRLSGIEVGKGAAVSGSISVWKHPSSFGVIGSRLRMNSGSVPNPTATGRKCCIHIAKGGTLVMGHNVGISGCTIVCRHKISIGNDVLFGGGVSVFDNDFHPIDYRSRDDSDSTISSAEVTIEDGVFLGFGVTVLKGVTIGRGAVIGAGAVVSKDIPAMEIWAGNPCRKIGDVQ